MNSGVYSLRNDITGEEYIGASGDVAARRNQHFSKLRAGTHYSPRLQESFSLYGEIAFSVRIIEPCDPGAHPEKEREWVERLRPVFNTNLLPSPQATIAAPAAGEELPPGDWRSIGEACEVLKIHRNTVWRWIKSGKVMARPGPMAGAAGNIASKLVDLDQLRPMVGDGLKIGRPPKPKG